MRAIKLMAALLSTLAMAGSATAALPMPYDMPRVPSVDGKTRTAVYEVDLSRLDKAGRGEPNGQHVTLATSMNAPARMASLTQTRYSCVDDEGERLTSCTVQSGTVMSVTPRPAGAVTPRVVAALNLDITELLELKDGQSPLGPVQYPAVGVMRLTQDIALIPGESLSLVSGPYLLVVRLKSVQ